LITVAKVNPKAAMPSHNSSSGDRPTSSAPTAMPPRMKVIEPHNRMRP
jgi:hypothetical protein